MRASLAVLALGAVACDMGPLSAADDLETDTTSAPIIGGLETDGFPEVVHLSTAEGACTGTLVARRLVLTAAHCVLGSSGGVVRFGSGFGDFTDTVAIFFSLPHRFYTGAVTRNDIAFVRLASDAPAGVVPKAINLTPLTANDLGATVRAVGFGHNNGPAQTGAGVKREVALNIDELTNQHIGLGDANKNICQGDSGGPTFNASLTDVLAVTSFGGEGCEPRSYVTRTDVFPEFVREVVSNWGDGPCSFDGECGTDCDEFGDPDCDSCALDFVCAANCPRVDLDCPVGGLVGDLCGDEFACESRVCVEATDDPRVKYCSQACDESDPEAALCPIPLTCDGGECRYVEPTPSAQGSSCDAGPDCRSGICDLENRICAEPCTGDDQCSALSTGDVEYACEDVNGTQACTIAVEGSCLGCGAGAGGLSGNAVLLFLLVIGYGAAARRRERRR